MWWCQHDGGFTFQSTAYEWSPLLFIRIKNLWDPFHVGMKLQQWLLDIVWHRVATQIFSSISPDKCVIVTAWWRIYLPIHSIWMKSNIFHMMHQKDVGSFPCGYKASKTAIWYSLRQRGNPNNFYNLAQQECDGDSMMEDIPSNPQHMNDNVNYLSYISRGCGNISMWVWSLNNSYLTSFDLIHMHQEDVESFPCGYEVWSVNNSYLT